MIEMAPPFVRRRDGGRWFNVRPVVLFRLVVAAAQAATILITWPLWQVRSAPPLLPALPLPQWNMGAWLLASLALALVTPRVGVAVHFLFLTIAFLMDQTRMQPECISLALLLLGAPPNRSAVMMARTHLIALWFFAGFHKLVCPGYYMNTVPRLFAGILGESPPLPLMFDVIRGAMAMFEIALALFALAPATRRLAAVLACLFHLGVFLYLAMRVHWNQAVWPWNIALAFAGFALIWPWKPSYGADWLECPRAIKAIALLILMSPAGFYFAWVDPYLAHCLYCKNTPYAVIETAEGKRRPIDAYGSLNVPLPPNHRLFVQYFERVASPGDKLIVTDPRWWAAQRGFATYEIVRER
jgi:hypothetical protein